MLHVARNCKAPPTCNLNCFVGHLPGNEYWHLQPALSVTFPARLVYVPIDLAWEKHSIADCKIVEVLPNMRYMPIGGHGCAVFDKKLESKSITGFSRNLDFSWNPYSSTWEKSIADCKTLEVLPDMRHMAAGGQGHQEGHTEKNPKSNAGIWRNLDFSFKPYSSTWEKFNCRLQVPQIFPRHVAYVIR